MCYAIIGEPASAGAPTIAPNPIELADPFRPDDQVLLYIMAQEIRMCT
jgi:hypothetical protein